MSVYMATATVALYNVTTSELHFTVSTPTSRRGSVNVETFHSQGIKIVYATSVIAMIAASLFGNFMVCHIVYQRPAMRSAINLLLANLALTDFLTALLCMPITLVALWSTRWPLGNTLCQINAVVFYSLLTEKMLVLLIISVDRYFIIVKRKDNLNPSKAKLITGLSWIFAVFLSTMPAIGWGEYEYKQGGLQCLANCKTDKSSNQAFLWLQAFLSVLLPVGVMSVAYGLIFRTVRRNCFRVQNHPPVNPTAMHKRGRMFIDYSYKTRTFTTIFILSLIFVACILPFVISGVWMTSNTMENELSPSARAVVLWLIYLGSPLNPVVYAFRISKFREACIEVLPRTVWSLPSCISLHSRRRIRPHVLYQVEKASIVTVTSVI